MELFFLSADDTRTSADPTTSMVPVMPDNLIEGFFKGTVGNFFLKVEIGIRVAPAPVSTSTCTLTSLINICKNNGSFEFTLKRAV